MIKEEAALFLFLLLNGLTKFSAHRIICETQCFALWHVNLSGMQWQKPCWPPSSKREHEIQTLSHVEWPDIVLLESCFYEGLATNRVG